MEPESSITLSKMFQSLEEGLQYICEANRRATFKSWVFDDNANCSAAKLAEAGFVFQGNKDEPDAVKCFLCNKHLDSWDESDDPWAEHLKHAPNCSFAKLDKPEKSLTVSELIDIRNEFVEIFIRNSLTEKLNIIGAVFDEYISSFNCMK